MYSVRNCILILKPSSNKLLSLVFHFIVFLWENAIDDVIIIKADTKHYIVENT